MAIGVTEKALLYCMDSHPILYNYVKFNNFNDFKKSIDFINFALRKLRNINISSKYNYLDLYYYLLTFLLMRQIEI